MGQGQKDKVYLGKCCCCVELKPGVLILGIICAILAGIGVIASIVGLIRKLFPTICINIIPMYIFNNFDSQEPVCYYKISFLNLYFIDAALVAAKAAYANTHNAQLHQVLDIGLTLVILNVIIYAIHFVSSVLLAVGSSKGNILSNSNVSAPSVSAIILISY